MARRWHWLNQFKVLPQSDMIVIEPQMLAIKKVSRSDGVVLFQRKCVRSVQCSRKLIKEQASNLSNNLLDVNNRLEPTCNQPKMATSKCVSIASVLEPLDICCLPEPYVRSIRMPFQQLPLLILPGRSKVSSEDTQVVQHFSLPPSSTSRTT